MSTHKSEDYKLSAVKYYLNNDVSLDDVCVIFGCPKQSLYRWIKRYNELKEIGRQNREPISYKITKEQIKYNKIDIVKWIYAQGFRPTRKFIDIAIDNINKYKNVSEYQDMLQFLKSCESEEENNINSDPLIDQSCFINEDF